MKLTTLAIALTLCGAALAAGIKPPASYGQAGAHAPKSGSVRPKTIRDFFNLLPPQYFALEGCAPERDVNCVSARAEYLKNYLEVEDTANGYMRGGCDGAQSCFQMALFRRPDGTYVVGLTVSHEESEQSYFLEYTGGVWSDIGARVVPEYGEDKVYELPRYGTTVRAFAKIFPEADAPAVSEKGRRLYDLVWKAGEFTIKK